MHPEPSTGAIVVKTAITHTVTYLVMGLLAYTLLDYKRLYVETELRHLMRPTTDALVMAGPLFQPLRGLIFGVVFVIIRRSWLGQPRGWLRLWVVLVGLGILSTFGPSPGSIEGAVYTTLPLRLHAIGLPEVLRPGPSAVRRCLVLGEPSGEALAALDDGRRVRAGAGAAGVGIARRTVVPIGSG